MLAGTQYHDPDDGEGGGIDKKEDWEDWERSEGRDLMESRPTPVLEKN